jgi:hypothetical protein
VIRDESEGRGEWACGGRFAGWTGKDSNREGLKPEEKLGESSEAGK